MIRAPFVSGLRDARPVPPPRYAAGIVRLEHIRTLALAEIKRLKPFTQARFDGVVRLPADDEAVIDSAAYVDLVRLINLIAENPEIKVMLATAMSEGKA